jgi:TetR/AcrR family transcriptional regulator
MARIGGSVDEGRPPTFTEQARAVQLIDVTIATVAEHGYQAASLAAIAQAAGVTKGAVLYHFASKDALLAAAQAQVLDAMVAVVGAAVNAAAPRDAPSTYVCSMLAHMTAHPQHARMLIEAFSHEGRPDPERRWKPLADLMAAARRSTGNRRTKDLRDLAIITGGAIDAIINERLSDPGYDSAAAAERLAAMVERSLTG